jgi:hypothetical protein
LRHLLRDFLDLRHYHFLHDRKIAGPNKKVGFRPLRWLDNSNLIVPCLGRLRKSPTFQAAPKAPGRVETHPAPALNCW